MSRLYRPLTEEFFDGAALTREQVAAAGLAEKRLEPQLSAALGVERFADFQQAKHGHRQLNELVVYLDLPISVARAVAPVEVDITRRAETIRAGGPVSAHRDARRPALLREAEQRVGELLGARGLELYRQHGGQWLENLAR